MIAAAELGAFARTIERRLGLALAPDRAAATAELIARRAAAHHEPLASYLIRVDSDAAELRAVASELTVGETYFFRHVEQFHAFADVALPERLLARERVNVLSAGCSTGEEPLTLAMLVRDRVGDAGRVRIHAVDVNPASLARAALGRYSRWALRATPSDLEARWFHTDGRDAVVSPALRAAVTFEQRSLVDDGELWTLGRWDVVFCRNVLMYFTEARALEVIARIARSLAPGGYLFLGHAETLRDRSEELELCNTHGTFYYRKTGQSGPRAWGLGPPEIMVPVAAPPDLGWFAEIQAATARIEALTAPADAAPIEPTEPPRASADPLVAVRELIRDERFGEALATLAGVPAAREVTLLRAIVFAHTGRFTDAEAACRELLDLTASPFGGAAADADAGAHYVLALCRDSLGDPLGAADHLERAGALDPTFAMARVHLGLIARRAGDRDTATRVLTLAITLLEREPDERLQLYGGGFRRQALVELCRAELAKGAA